MIHHYFIKNITLPKRITWNFLNGKNQNQNLCRCVESCSRSVQVGLWRRRGNGEAGKHQKEQQKVLLALSSASHHTDSTSTCCFWGAQVGKTMDCLEQGMAVKRRWWRWRTRWELLDTQRQRLETVSKPKWLTEVRKEGEINVPIHSKLLKSLKCLWIWEGECEQLKSACFIIEPTFFSVKSNSKTCCNCGAIRYV